MGCESRVNILRVELLNRWGTCIGTTDIPMIPTVGYIVSMNNVEILDRYHTEIVHRTEFQFMHVHNSTCKR